LNKEILIASKSLFKNKYLDFSVYLNDSLSFCEKIINFLYDVYITNLAELMFIKMFYFEEMYESYNELIIEKNLLEMRKYVIDIIFIIHDVIKHLHAFEPVEQLIHVIERVICSLLKQILAFLEEESQIISAESNDIALQVY
jgi:hypothetical protein